MPVDEEPKTNLKKPTKERIMESFHNWEHVEKRVERKLRRKDKRYIEFKNPKTGESFVVPYASLIDLLRDSADLYRFPWVGVISLILSFSVFFIQVYLIWRINNLESLFYQLVDIIDKLIANAGL